MITVKKLLEAVAGLPHQLANATVYGITELNVVERGQFEGGIAMIARPVTGIALGPNGLILFVDKSDEYKIEQVMMSFPPGFQSGDPEIDRHIREQFGTTGEEWKNG